MICGLVTLIKINSFEIILKKENIDNKKHSLLLQDREIY